VTDSPSDSTQPADTTEAEAVVTQAAPLEEFAAELAAALGSETWSAANDTVRIDVRREEWPGAITAALTRLPFFSWLSAIDWSRDVAVGEPAEDAEDLTERFEVMCRLSSVTSADAAIIATTLPKDDAWIDSLVNVSGGAEWHEREAAEMFGIEFRGHPNLTHLYLPDSFEGHPLLKSYPLLAREVKPWPGTVDVEDMPSTENKEAEALQGDGE
jgi:NADH-quinone oxidoreductase subunit C